MKTSFGHLTYCTNIHSGESWKSHFNAFSQHFAFIKEQVSPQDNMGLGLRLSNEASLELNNEDSLNAFKEWLQVNKAYVFTLNGFPYGGFHNTVVKDQVHAPDWTTPERVLYTLRLFKILETLLPAGMDGGISTSPLSYRFWFNCPEDLSLARRVATDNIISVIIELIRVHRSSGKLLHLDIEPEPDGVLESGPEFIQWFEEELLISGSQKIMDDFGVTHGSAQDLIKQHLRLCYDVCHFAIGYEPHHLIINTLLEKGIKIGKIQVSAALKANIDASGTFHQDILNAFSAFDERTYLHQVVAKKEDGELVRYRDLPQALADSGNPSVREWRAHFHVPVSESNYGKLHSTQDEIVQVLNLHKSHMLTQHLEVETYTWEVLPAKLQMPLQQSIISELLWAKNMVL